MTTALTSLAAPGNEQPDLPLAGGASFLDGNVLEFAQNALEANGRGQHTAARLFLRNPQLYKAIMWLYASGSAGQLKTAEVLGVSVHTVRAVIQREKLTPGAAMDTAKTLASMADLRAMTLETLIEKLADKDERKKIPFDKLMIGLGIQTEKIELLKGNATERVEHVDGRPAADEFQRWLEEGAIDVESTETGFTGENPAQKGDRPALGQAAGAPGEADAPPDSAADQADPAQPEAPVSGADSMYNDVVASTKPNETAVARVDDVTPDVPAATPSEDSAPSIGSGGAS